MLEATYDPIADDATWAAQIVDTANGLFERSAGVGLQVLGHDAEWTSARIELSHGIGAVAPFAHVIATADPVASFGFAATRAFFYPLAMVSTQSEIEPCLDAPTREFVRAQRSHMGVADLVGICVHPEPGVALVVSSALEGAMSPTRHERQLLSRLGLHLSAAFRLRRRPESVQGILSLDGDLAERGDRPDPNAIALTVRRLEAARSRSGGERLLGLWTALVQGRYSLVPRTENGRRRYLVLENALPSQAMRALTRREIDVLTMAARGIATKLIAYGLGMSPPAVSSSLARAASKLGLSSRLELVRLAATITADPRANAQAATVTAAESEILELLRQGLSNRDIARLRSRSVHTIANQVASLLRKMNSASRRNLALRPA
jgi:DNA-binding CsgD family transcriptional regulator